jgi:hypothetical protein
VLKHKGLIDFMGVGKFKLTPGGVEVCLHPELLDDYLGPRGVAPAPVQHIQHNTINAQQLQNAQQGNHNVLNATYSTVLQQLVKEIEDSDVPPDKKQEWIATLHDIMSNPFTQTAITLAGTALMQK